MLKLAARRAPWLGTPLVLIGVIAGPVDSAAASHHRLHGVDLTVTRGAVTLSRGHLSGSFTVRNVGTARALRSRADVSITNGRHSRTLGVYRVSALEPQTQTRIAVFMPAPTRVPAGTYRVLACAGLSATGSGFSEDDHCARIGTLRFTADRAGGPRAPGTTATTPTPTSTPTPTPAPNTSTTAATATPSTTTASPTPAGPAPTTTGTGAPGTPTLPQPGPNQIPTAPMTIVPDTPMLVQDSYDGMTGSYDVTTPPSYDPTGATPMRLLVWMHGCGGDAEGDSYETIASNTLDSAGDPQADDSRDFIVISIEGTDGGCWDPNTDVEKVLMAISDVTTRFNIDRRHVFIGGYSSGGDLAYRTIFYNADEFAGILTVNTNPFRDTGSTEAQSLAAAAWRFNIAHVAHSGDEEYHVNPCTGCLDGGADDPGVTPAIHDLISAGYNVNYFIEPGTHSDPDDFRNGTGTDYDWRQYVRPFIDNPSWESPS